MAFTVFYCHWFRPIDEILQKVSPAFLSKNGDVQGYGVNPWYEASQSSYLFLL